MSRSFHSSFASVDFLARALAVLLLIFAGIAVVRAEVPSSELTRTFPTDLGGFHQVEPVLQLFPVTRDNPTIKDYSSSVDFSKTPQPVLVATAGYASPSGEKLSVELTKWENDAAAYSNLTGYRKLVRGNAQVREAESGQLGTASSLISPQTLIFFKGSTFVVVKSQNGQNLDGVKAFAKAFAQTLDAGEGDIPVLVKHLPNWETAQRDAVYSVSASTLLSSVPNQPILNEISFEGGTEAVVANYGPSQLAIVEFSTPQFSIECDQRIWTRISELKSQGQPAPIGYRRIGNYSVFVFNAPDETTANALIDQVKYEQVVQWLGDDPHMADRLQRYFSHTTAGVLIAVLKSSGLSLLICLAAGTLFGALLFRRRRARQAAFYSDAGGATRLNLDELTDRRDPRPLLGAGKRPDSDSTQT